MPEAFAGFDEYPEAVLGAWDHFGKRGDIVAVEWDDNDDSLTLDDP